jgi:hypothetical protein
LNYATQRRRELAIEPILKPPPPPPAVWDPEAERLADDMRRVQVDAEREVRSRLRGMVERFAAGQRPTAEEMNLMALRGGEYGLVDVDSLRSYVSAVPAVIDARKKIETARQAVEDLRPDSAVYADIRAVDDEIKAAVAPLHARKRDLQREAHQRAFREKAVETAQSTLNTLWRDYPLLED